MKLSEKNIEKTQWIQGSGKALFLDTESAAEISVSAKGRYALWLPVLLPQKWSCRPPQLLNLLYGGIPASHTGILTALRGQFVQIPAETCRCPVFRGEVPGMSQAIPLPNSSISGKSSPPHTTVHNPMIMMSSNLCRRCPPFVRRGSSICSRPAFNLSNSISTIIFLFLRISNAVALPGKPYFRE